MEENITKMPLIGEKAPAFTAVTTQGTINFPADYEGKWVILFSHPADFTPVCTTEFMTFASLEKEFKALNTELIGLSIDSLYAHIAWLRKIQELEWNGHKNLEVKFPLIEDITMNVAKKYGMIQPNQSTTQAVRAVLLSTPKELLERFFTIQYQLDVILMNYFVLSKLFKKLTKIMLQPQLIGDQEMTLLFQLQDHVELQRKEWKISQMISIV